MEGAVDILLPYIPEHLHYIFFELIKNSMRAVVERYRNRIVSVCVIVNLVHVKPFH